MMLTYCKYFYYSHFIPVCLYGESGLLCMYPKSKQQSVFILPQKYTVSLLTSDKNIDLTYTSFGAYLGCVHIPDTKFTLIIGPVSATPYQRDDLFAIRKEFENTDIPYSVLASCFQSIPVLSRDTFFNMLSFIGYAFDMDSFDIEDIKLSDDIHVIRDTQQLYVNQPKDEAEFNENKYYMETRLLHCVETGDLKALEIFYQHAQYMQVGKIAHDSLRQAKNTFISALSIISRAAIRGGLTPTVAYQLSDTYFQQVEKLSNSEAVRQLTWQMQKDYTTRVSENTALIHSSDVIQNALNFIRENTRRKITTSDVADYIGVSRSHLSRQFTTELGFSMKSFILRCKLEEGKALLAYSSYDISEISNLLCFSNQSHFQRAFRNLYGMTPLKYRHMANNQIT